jgi:hypothetical protein
MSVPLIQDQTPEAAGSEEANGHNLCITVTPERTLVPVGECPLHITVINV